MAHPTRTGDLVVFAYPPYQFDAETPGTLVAPSHFFGQHGYVPDVQDLVREREHAGDVPGRRPRASPGARSRRARSTSRRRWRSCSTSPSRSRARARCSWTSPSAASGYKPISIIGLNDFHGQLDPTNMTFDGHQRAGRRRRVPRHAVRRGPGEPARPGPDPGRRRQRRRVAAELPAAAGQAGDRRRERVGPGRDVLRQPRVRLRRRRGCSCTRSGANFPFLATNIIDEADRRAARLGDAVGRVQRQRREGRRHRRRAEGHAGARRRPATPRACSSSTRRRASRPSPSGSSGAA